MNSYLGKIDVSIIIVNFNTFEVTRSCINSIISSTTETRYEIILVDNNSIDRSPDNFLKFFPELILIKNKTNVGFGIANNQGMAIARGTYILLLNSDCYLLNNAIDLAFHYAVSRPETEIFGAMLMNEDGSEQKSFYRTSRINLVSSFMSVLLGNPLAVRIMGARKNPKLAQIGGLYGAYIWLHRSVYEETKGFDPDFFMYCEDTEWFRNRIAPLFRVDICREAKVCHLGGKSGTYSIVNPQNILSFYLYWYKLGKTHFWIYSLGSFTNLIFIAAMLPFMSKRERSRNATYLKITFRLMPTILLEIPKYGNKYGSRPYPLKVKGKR